MTAISSKKSRSDPSHDDLARNKEFLASLANLPDNATAPAYRRFDLRFGSLFRPEVPWTVVNDFAFRMAQEEFFGLTDEFKLWNCWLLPLRDAVRMIWGNPDLRLKRWRVFKILEKFFLIGDRSVSMVPVADETEWLLGSLRPPSPCEEALMLLVGYPSLTKLCMNRACATKYFWASRPKQKYCSEPCAIPAKREAKNKWWAAHGLEWRSKRQKSTGKPIKKRNQHKKRHQKRRS